MQLIPTLLATFLLSAGSLLAAPSTGSAQEAVGMASSSSTTDSFGAALNEFRASNGLGGLRQDPRLTAAAQAYAEDMAQNAHFSHTGRDGSNHAQRARAAGCQGRGYMAENIAWGQPSAQHAFNGWAASAGHRAAMLGRPYNVFGLGQSNGSWVLMFADGC